MTVGSSYASKTANVFRNLSSEIASGANRVVNMLEHDGQQVLNKIKRPSAPKRYTSSSSGLQTLSDAARQRRSNYGYYGGSEKAQKAISSGFKVLGSSVGSKAAAGGILAAPVVAGGAALNSMRPSNVRQRRDENQQKLLEKREKFAEKGMAGRSGMLAGEIGKSFAKEAGYTAIGLGGFVAAQKYAKMFRTWA